MSVQCRPARLSKSRYLDGVQCARKLWLRAHEPDAPELVPDAGQEALFRHGHEVGELARQYVPGGVLIPVDRRDLRPAVLSTGLALGAGMPLLYEASFTSAGVFCAIDILAKEEGRYVVTEVKASTKVKDVHVVDLALQVWILRAAGLEVVRAEVMYLNKECRFPDLSNLFVREDVTAAVEVELPNVGPRITELRSMLAGEMPSADLGSGCKKPYPCPFIPRCHKDRPRHHVEEFYRLSAKKRSRFRADGVERIPEVPARVSLTEIQTRQREAVSRGKCVVKSGLRRILEDIRGPAAYMDFETVTFPVPRWPGCRPWQQVPVQFSVHVEGENGMEHHEFLAEGPGDPRREFAEGLLEAVRGAGSILVWCEAFERGRIAELADALPDLADELMELDSRVVDLLPIVRNHVYHPDFRGSFSIKKVLPALCPGMGWDDLDVQDGVAASAELERLLLRPWELEVEECRRRLLAYCERDTEAMVVLLERLRALDRKRESGVG